MSDLSRITDAVRLTARQVRLRDQYTCCKKKGAEYQAILKVRHQYFEVGSSYCTDEGAHWMRCMLAKALDRIVAEALDNADVVEGIGDNILMTTKLYGGRDPHKLEPHYSKHVEAMTREGLIGKHEIAEELAYRDLAIEDLRGRVQFLVDNWPEKLEQGMITFPDGEVWTRLLQRQNDFAER